MTLGEAIRDYRELHGLSVRSFAKLCGLSNTYVATLEKGVTPRGDIPVPSIETYRACANAMGMTVDELVRQVDDYIDLTEKPNSNQMVMKEIFDSIADLDEEKLKKLLKIINTTKDVL